MQRMIFLFVFVCLPLLLQASQSTSIHGFTVIRSQRVQEANGELTELVHEASGAKVLSIHTDDPENFFSISFRTRPETSNGVAHVLEHSVLQGSKNYPVHNLFYSMRKRSFATYINAFTTIGYTSYPAASQSDVDFYNLLAVYSDAVFHPLLSPLAFKQEGHRLEFSSPFDTTSPLVYKGIVYNEMKGYFTSSLQRLMKHTLRELMPLSLGSVNMGGDPKVIPQLTYEELVAFHKAHYYPGNSLFFFYGNLPLEKHLEFLDTKVLKGFERKSLVASIPPEKPFSERKQVVHYYPATQAEVESPTSTHISFGWLIDKVEDPEELLAIKLLAHYLLSSDAAPLKEKLVTSGLCKGVSVDFMDEYPQAPFCIFLQGCRKDDQIDIRELISTTLKEIAQVGLPLNKLERALHGFEIAFCELKRGTKPVGYVRFYDCAVQMLFGRDAGQGVNGPAVLERVRKKIEGDPNYLPKILSKHFVNNVHEVTVALVPSQELAGEEQNFEKEQLESIAKTLSVQDIDEIVQTSRKIHQAPDRDVTEELLPKVSLGDVSQEVQKFALKREEVGSLDLYHYPVFTNHLTYASLVFQLPKIEQEDLWLIPLYVDLMGKLAIGSGSYADTLERIEDQTGGVQASLSFAFDVEAVDNFRPQLMLSSKSLDRKANELFSLLYDIMTTIRFTEKERIRQLVEKSSHSLQMALRERPLDFASTTALSCASQANCLLNHCRGLEYVERMQWLASDFQNQFEALSDRLTRLHSRILSSGRPALVLACNDEQYARCKQGTLGGLAGLATKDHEPWQYDYDLPVPTKSFVEIQSPVAFNVRAQVSLPFGHEDSPYIRLGALIATNKVLSKQIRRQGGAYSAGLEYDPNSGNMLFYSYRDPYIASTNRSFEQGLKCLVEGDFDEKDLEEAKVSLLQRIDAPIGIQSQAFIAYLYHLEGNTEALRKKQRTKLLKATKADIQCAAKNHLIAPFKESRLVTFSSKELFERETLHK